jgi:hypothetical protein
MPTTSPLVFSRQPAAPATNAKSKANRQKNPRGKWKPIGVCYQTAGGLGKTRRGVSFAAP